MTDREVEKKLVSDLKKEFGAFVSVTDLVNYTGRSWEYNHSLISECKPFGEGKRKKYFYLDAAEAICRNS